MSRSKIISFQKILGLRIACAMAFGNCSARAEDSAIKLKVLAFYTGKNNLAHMSFTKKANRWLRQAAEKYDFGYEATTTSTDLKDETLARHQVVLFLDTRPKVPEQRLR